MKRLKQTCLTAIIIIGLLTSLSFGQTKIAQTGFNFLSITSDARSSGMSDAVNSLSGFSGSMFSNPASMAKMPNLLNASFSMNNWIADIKYMSFSTIISPSSGDWGTIGLSVQTVNYGDVEGTMVDRNNSAGYDDIGIIKPTAFCASLGYATMLNDKFGIGGRIKYAAQSLGSSYFQSDAGDVTSKENKAHSYAYDFGTIYYTGFRSIAFGMSVTNFSSEVTYELEGFQLPLLFTIGISANLFELINSPQSNQGLLVSLDWTHPRSHPEQLRVGLEYEFMKVLALRLGYVNGSDENKFSYGLGLTSLGFGIDYSYEPYGVFGHVQQFTARFSM